MANSKKLIFGVLALVLLAIAVQVHSKWVYRETKKTLALDCFLKNPNEHTITKNETTMTDCNCQGIKRICKIYDNVPDEDETTTTEVPEDSTTTTETPDTTQEFSTPEPEPSRSTVSSTTEFFEPT